MTFSRWRARAPEGILPRTHGRLLAFREDHGGSPTGDRTGTGVRRHIRRRSGCRASESRTDPGPGARSGQRAIAQGHGRGSQRGRRLLAGTGLDRRRAANGSLRWRASDRRVPLGPDRAGRECELPPSVSQCFIDQPISEKSSKDVIFVGRLDDNKGILKLIAAIESCTNDMSLSIIGQGPLQTEVIDLIDNVKDKIDYIPYLGSKELAKIV